MLLKKTAILLTVAVFGALPVSATQIEEASFHERLSHGDETLILHGVAVYRYRVLFKAYAAALYLGDGVPAERALEDVPRRLEIEYFWDIPAEGFAKATLEGISRNVDPSTLARLVDRIERFNAFYTDVRPGDRYALTYVPGAGTVLSLNGEVRGSIEGADFAAALFSIWLGDVPFDATLKTQLLGRS